MCRPRFPGKTQSEQIFHSRSALVDTSEIHADQTEYYCVKVKSGAAVVIVPARIHCGEERNVWAGGEKLNTATLQARSMYFKINVLFLGGVCFQFPYAAPPPQEPVKTLRSLINIRKDTLRLVRYAPPSTTAHTEALITPPLYNVWSRP